MTESASTWDAHQYAKFLDERTRPANELLRRVPLEKVARAVDLGCGPGNSTIILKERWTDADVSGCDNSEDMLEKARKDYPYLKFWLQDVAGWNPEEKVDLAFSNAVLQWVPDHQTLLPRLMSHITSGGVLAFQLPHNHEKPTHRLMREVASENKWSFDLTTVRNAPPVLTAQEYYNILQPHSTSVDIWETEYFHVLESIDAVVEWLKGTGLRPFLAPLSADEQTKFLELYAEKLREFIPRQADGKVLLPFPRLFVVATNR